MKNKFLYGGIFAGLVLTGCLKEEEMKKPFTGFAPKNIGDGWIISTPSAEGMDSLALVKIYRDAYADDNTWMVKSLLVFRNGKLVAESYLKDDVDRTTRAPIWSCTKQVNSILAGIAIDQGYIGDVNDSIGKYLPEYISRYPAKEGMTLKHLLTMTSGLDFDNGGQSDVFRQHLTENSIDYVLGLDLKYPIGTNYHYKDADPQVVSGIVQRATGMTLDEYGEKVLFNPLGVNNYEWERYTDGITMGPWGILTTPRELAKIGECVLDSGRHNNQQLIPISWWHEMLSVQIPNAHDDAAFGYYWWSIPANGWYFMWGHGGQYVFLKPAKRLMIVATSLPQVEDDFAFWYDDMVNIADRIAATIE